MTEFENKTVIIAGGGGSIGKAFAKLFAEQGAAVVGVARSAESLEEFTASIDEAGGRSLAIAADLRDWNTSKRVADRTVETFGTIDVLITTQTARTAPRYKPIEECSHDEISNLMESAPVAALGIMQAVFPYMKKRGGKIINCGSGAGRNPAPGLGPHGMCKAAMHLLTKSAAREWAKYRINVNGILPMAMTDNVAMALRDNPEELAPYIPPLGRFGDPKRDIGSVALFLASSASDYVTGQNIPVDGGMDMLL